MNATHSSDRFHALEATRAFALMLGVVFHAVWSFVPAPVGAPAVDVSANRFYDWFFFTSHTFQMQLFFLIAGFFAHMVCHRKGFAYYAKNRLNRIVVPLILGWLILFPLIKAAWFTGANLAPSPSFSPATTIWFAQVTSAVTSEQATCRPGRITKRLRLRLSLAGTLSPWRTV